MDGPATCAPGRAGWGSAARAFALTAAVLAAGCSSGPPPTTTAKESAAAKDKAQPDDGNLRELVELARGDIRREKAAIVARNLPLTESEAAAFWPVYREYELELSKLMDRKIETLRKYFANAGAMTDDQAKALADDAVALEDERTALKRTYLKKFQGAIPPTKTARFFQIDNQVNTLVELHVAAALPLIK